MHVAVIFLEEVRSRFFSLHFKSVTAAHVVMELYPLVRQYPTHFKFMGTVLGTVHRVTRKPSDEDGFKVEKCEDVHNIHSILTKNPFILTASVAFFLLINLKDDNFEIEDLSIKA